jgi:hypothetical protein
VSAVDEAAQLARLPPVDSLDLWPLFSGANLTSPRCEVLFTPLKSETDAKLTQKLGQLQLFLAVFPQEYLDQLVSFGPT